MVYSGYHVERVQLAETTAWSGAPSMTDVSPSARAMIGRIRELLFAGRNGEAQQLVNEHLLGRPTSFGTNLPLPELIIGSHRHGPVTGFRRSLDLRDAIARTSYQADRVPWSREVFASHPDRVLAVRIEAGERGAVPADGAVRRLRVSRPGHPRRVRSSCWTAGQRRTCTVTARQASTSRYAFAWCSTAERPPPTVAASR